MSLLLNPGYQFIPCTASRGIMPSFYKHFYFDNTAVCVLYRALLESDCSNKEFTRSRHIYSQLKPLRSYSYNLRRILISPFYFQPSSFQAAHNYRGCSVLRNQLQSIHKFQREPIFLTYLTHSDCDKAVRDHLIGYFFFLIIINLGHITQTNYTFFLFLFWVRRCIQFRTTRSRNKLNQTYPT